jgi:N-acetylmuramic acid 6-phosphate etherase
LPHNINKKDTVIGISCSGASAYVIASLNYSKSKGASTVYLVTNPKPYMLTEVDVIIKANTGPEVITGSTRMKAGSATKMILNMISTTTMIKLGKVYKNLMIDLMAVNNKLIDRGIRIIMKITGLSYEKAKKKLFEAKKSVKAAIIMIKLDCDLEKANKKIKKFNGVLSNIIND